MKSAVELTRMVPPGAVGMIASLTIPERERDALEAAGLSWCDGRGAIHVAWPGTLVHVDHSGRGPRRGRTEPAKLGPAGIRAVQVLLAVDGEWTISRLAHEAAISVGQAHNVFKALEAERLLASTGKGPQQRRRITDRHGAMDWLATIDRARRRPGTAATYLYARTPEEVLRRFAERADAAGLPYAVTGAAASQLLGAPVLSQIIVSHIRVGPVQADSALHRLGLEHLDAEDAGRGMNLELWTDTGELGTFAARDVNGVRVAPPVRVWLDLARQGGRGADAAQLFREQVLERA
ncbi:hypothetical protein [Cellulomonas bogoriensis]|uniref:hypothetical protein n=1 Tax=Cellulomonas bogoriensis TaxID=301388 RepID=UPI0012EB9C6D|nr:hypothetical protein [Cellulomonas bogoriensis]